MKRLCWIPYRLMATLPAMRLRDRTISLAPHWMSVLVLWRWFESCPNEKKPIHDARQLTCEMFKSTVWMPDGDRRCVDGCLRYALQLVHCNGCNQFHRAISVCFSWRTNSGYPMTQLPAPCTTWTAISQTIRPTKLGYSWFQWLPCLWRRKLLKVIQSPW